METRVGKIVNYVIQDGAIIPAIIVKVHPDRRVNMQVFHDGSSGCAWAEKRAYDGTENPEPGTWHWAEV